MAQTAHAPTDPDGFDVWTDEVGGTSLVVRAVGEVDLLTAPKLAKELTEAASRASDQCLVVDLSAVAFLGSAGLNALMDGVEMCRRLGVGFAVYNPHPRARRAIELANLVDELLRPVPDAPR